MTNTATTTMVMADMSKACKEVIEYCRTHAKKGIIYEGTLMNSICWNMCHKMYSRRDSWGYTYVSLTDEEKAACNQLYKEVVRFLKCKKTDKGYKQFIFNMDKLFITVIAEVPETEPTTIPVPVAVPVAPVFEEEAEEQTVAQADKDDVPWYD